MTKIFKPERERYHDSVRTELNTRLTSLVKRRAQTDREIEDIKNKLDKLPAPDKIIITNHAVERYQQRINNLPAKIVKKVLSDPTLLRRYKVHGSGLYRLADYPNVITVIVNFTIVTVKSDRDPKQQLVILEQYMDKWLDLRASAISDGKPFKPPSFEYFRMKYYESSVH